MVECQQNERIERSIVHYSCINANQIGTIRSDSSATGGGGWIWRTAYGAASLPTSNSLLESFNRVRYTHRVRRCGAFAGCFRIVAAPSATIRAVCDGSLLASVSRRP